MVIKVSVKPMTANTTRKFFVFIYLSSSLTDQSRGRKKRGRGITFYCVCLAGNMEHIGLWPRYPILFSYKNFYFPTTKEGELVFFFLVRVLEIMGGGKQKKRGERHHGPRNRRDKKKEKKEE
jgi:hypothetical protein